MDCNEAKGLLVDLLTGGRFRGTQKKGLLGHLAVCSACSEEKEGLEKVWKDLGILPEIEVPRGLHDATVSRIGEMLQEAQPESLPARRRKNSFAKPLAAIFGGIAMAFLSLWVLRGVATLEQFSSEAIFLCSALWTGILAGAFLLATGSLPEMGFRWQWASRIGLLSLGLTMLGTLLCPEMNLIQWWSGLPPGEILLSFGYGISQGAFGFLYAFLPFFIAICTHVKGLKGQIMPQIPAAGVLFFIVLLPAIYLQASSLSSVVFMNWALGSGFGVAIAALCGAGVYKLGPWNSAASA